MSPSSLAFLLSAAVTTHRSLYVFATRSRKAAAAPLNVHDEHERTFLAACVAVPTVGASALAELDLDADLVSDASRAAAGWLRAHLDDPAAGLDEQDPALQAVIREILVRVADVEPNTDAFTVTRLQLALARAQREAAAARRAHAGVDEAERRRVEVQAQLSAALDRVLEANAPR